MAEHKHRLALQFVGKMDKSADFEFCALPTNRIITKAKLSHASHLLGLSRLHVYTHVSASETSGRIVLARVVRIARIGLNIRPPIS
jgi:hypothetical protein